MPATIPSARDRAVSKTKTTVPMEFKWSLHSHRINNIQISRAMRLGVMPNGADVNTEKKRSRDSGLEHSII